MDNRHNNKDSHNKNTENDTSNDNLVELFSIFFVPLDVFSNCKNTHKTNKNHKGITNQRHRNILSTLSPKYKPINKI